MSRLGRSNYGGKLTKGTTGERDIISSPSSGDLHYNTSTNQMNLYVNGSWKSLNLTIPSNQVALLTGSNEPGSANNNNVFYKNTNPYNLQVYRNAWKTLPLQLTNEPSFSYGTTIPSNSSGNRGDVFYNTTNNTLNLRRNHPLSINNQWFSILDEPFAPPIADLSLGNGIFTQSATNNLYKKDGTNFYVAIHKSHITTTEKTLDIDYINTSYSATGVKVYTFTGGSSGGSAQSGERLYDYMSYNGSGGHVMAVYSGAAGGSGTISRYMRIETANVADTSLRYKGTGTDLDQIEIKLINNQNLSASKTDISWENTDAPSSTQTGVTSGTYYQCGVAASGEDAKTFTKETKQKSGSRYQHTIKYTGQGIKFNNGTTTELLQWPPSLPFGYGAGDVSSVPYRETWDPPGSYPNPPPQTSYRSAHTVNGLSNGTYTDFDLFLSTSGGKDINSSSSSDKGQNIQFAFETEWPENSSHGNYQHIFYQGANGPGGSFVYEDDGYLSWRSEGRYDIWHLERTSSTPPTISNDSDFTNRYGDTVIKDCINSLNTTFGNNFQSNFYNQISGGKGGWVSAGTYSSYYKGPVNRTIESPVLKGMPDYPIFLVYEGLVANML